jgi:hypothetical protein
VRAPAVFFIAALGHILQVEQPFSGFNDPRSGGKVKEHATLICFEVAKPYFKQAECPKLGV